MSGYDRRIVNESGNEIFNPDLSLGYLVDATVIRQDATPIDNVKKFAWYDDDYEKVYMYIAIPEKKRIENRIIELKKKLSDTDYIINKVIEGVAVWEDYPNIKETRQQWRNEINELEKILC